MNDPLPHRRFAAATVLAVACIALVPLAAPPCADAAIQYPARYTWRTLTGEHFLVHYHKGGEALAREALRYAEEANILLSEDLGWQPRAKVHIAVTDNFDFSNGSASVFPLNNVNIWVTPPPPAAENSLGYYDDWMKLVIYHELAHIYHLDQARGGIEGLRKIFGRLSLTFPNAFSPLWVIEGWATYAESKLTGYGRANSSYLDMVVRTAALTGTMPTMGRANGTSPSWPGGHRRYLFGARFFQYVAAQHGEDAWRRYFTEYSSNLIPYRVDSAGEAALGEPLSDLWIAWMAVEKERAEKVQAAIAQEGETRFAALTELGYETLYPVVSPDGSLVAFSYEGPFRSAEMRVHRLAREGAALRLGEEVDRFKVNLGAPVAFSPDGRSLVYAEPEFTSSFIVRSDIHIREIGGRSRRVTRGARLFHPAFAADGRTIYAVKTELGGNALVAVDIAGGAQRTVLELSRQRILANPAPSPDGRWIAITEGGGGRADIVLYGTDGSRGTVVTAALPGSLSSHAAWSADGRDLYFGSDADGNIPNVFVWRGDRIEQLSNVTNGVVDPAPLPGGGVLAASYGKRGFDIAALPEPRVVGNATGLVREALEPRDEPGPGQAKKLAGAPGIAQKATSSRYSPWPSLAPKWWFPILQSSSADGTILGVTTSGSDALNFHLYAFSYAERVGGGSTFQTDEETDEDEHDDLQLDDDRAYVAVYAYTRLFPNLVLLAADYSRGYTDIVEDEDGDDLFYRENVQRLQADLSFPFQRWNQGGQLSLGYVRDELDPLTRIPASFHELAGIKEGVLAGARAGLIWGNYKEWPYSISRENGLLFAAEYEELLESLGSDYEHWQAKGDLRAYMRIPLGDTPMRMHALAAQVRYGTSGGERIAQRLFRVGGTGYSEEILGIDVNEFPVRGFPGDALRGMNAASGAIEYRFPLTIIERGPNTIPIYFDRLTWTFFGEGGAAWGETEDDDAEFDADAAIASVGAELGARMVFGYYAPMTLRLGLAYRIQDPRDDSQIDDDNDSTADNKLQIYLGAGVAF